LGAARVNQKGPEVAFLAALHAFKASGRKLPVNLVLVAEGEEEIASPHFRQIVNDPEAAAALRNTVGVIIPGAGQESNGATSIDLGAKGVIEVQLISSGENWGRGPAKDITRASRPMSTARRGGS
jgi:acetylornithine deacetylase/succinyl-diaminopimelate desuccinylase-like protein